VSAPKVFLTQCDAYDREVVQQKVEEAFAAFGGVGTYATAGSRVLVKPNLLAGAPPQRAVTTHPAVVEAALKLLLEAGAKVTVADSPGFSSAAKVAAKSGIAEVAHRLGVEIAELDESVEVSAPGGSLFRKVEVARAALEADAIINLAKFKTHGQMILTMAVKNLFGCVVGHRKAQWHMAAGIDRDAFARLLLELWRLLPRTFSLVDGIVAMDGNGPSAGRARAMNLLLAGEDALAVDRIAARLVGLAENRFPLVRAARQIDELGPSLGHIDVVGGSVEALAVDDFELPAGSDIALGPRILRRVFGRALSARPKVNRRKCRLCGICVESCPPQAMTMAGGRVSIDYSACISCFCCQEMCPERAIDVRRGWLAKVIIH